MHTDTLEADDCWDTRILHIQYSIHCTKSADIHALHTHSSLHLLLPHIATTASAVGIPEATIKILGCWRSMAYVQYVRPSAFTLVGVAPRLLSSASFVNQAWAHSILVESTDYIYPEPCFPFYCVCVCVLIYVGYVLYCFVNILKVYVVSLTTTFWLFGCVF